YTVGHLARNTFWNWAAGGGFDSKGNRIGFNLVQGVNETGRTENAVWINDKLIKVSVMDFIYDDMDILKPWRIVSDDGKIDLSFMPEGERCADENFAVIVSKFRQPFGVFSGMIADGSNCYTFEKVFGFAEEHFAKW
ncbi:MAG: DUF2804 family protein, partial [Deltaproteobacteria bacterium]